MVGRIDLTTEAIPSRRFGVDQLPHASRRLGEQFGEEQTDALGDLLDLLGLISVDRIVSVVSIVSVVGVVELGGELFTFFLRLDDLVVDAADPPVRFADGGLRGVVSAHSFRELCFAIRSGGPRQRAEPGETAAAR